MSLKMTDRRTGVVAQVHKNTAAIQGLGGAHGKTPTVFIWPEFPGTASDIGRKVEFSYRWNSRSGIGRREASEVSFIDVTGDGNGDQDAREVRRSGNSRT